MRPPLPHLPHETAAQRVRLAEDAWNSRDPGTVAQAYSLAGRCRNRDEFMTGGDEIFALLTCKWMHEHDYRLFRWPLGGRPDSHPSLSEPGL